MFAQNFLKPFFFAFFKMSLDVHNLKHFIALPLFYYKKVLNIITSILHHLKIYIIHIFIFVNIFDIIVLLLFLILNKYYFIYFIFYSSCYQAPNAVSVFFF